MKVLIVGGYGTFGGRLVDLLIDHAGLEIIVAGRNLAKAEKFCRMRSGAAKLLSLVMERSEAEAALVSIKPDIVVDATGPFQAYGEKPYVLVEACLKQGRHYLDLADGADFVAGIARFDADAKAKGLFVLSGVSSFPVLSAAVVRHLARNMQVLQHVEAGVAPSPRAGVGLNVVKAIASYAGKPVKLLRDGQWTTRAGFFDSRHFVVNVPGSVPLPPLRFGLAEVPDLQVLKWMRPELQSVWVGAGPRPALLHRALWLAAGLVKLRLLPSLLPFAPLMNLAINTLRWGEHRGGMIVRVTGQENGKACERSWHLLAEGDSGPMIPSMATAAIIARVMEGKSPTAGARSAHEDLELADFEPWFARFAMRTGTRNDSAVLNLYETIMGDSLTNLAAPLQDFHKHTQTFTMSGEADIEGAANPIAGLVRRVIGFPATGTKVATTVTIEVDGQNEIWHRNFGGKAFLSRQWRGRGRDDGLLMESFGPLNFAMAVVEKEGELHLVPRQWNLFGIPLPRFLMPRAVAFEHGSKGRFNFDVHISLPLIGRITRYRGWLAKQPSES